MKVLLTGNKGYIGSHVEKALWSCGHGVVGLDMAARGFEGMHIQDDVAGFWNVKAVEKALKDVDVVVHCAGSCSVEKSIKHPIIDCKMNVLGTLNMMEVAHRVGVKRFVNMSSGGALSSGARSPYGIGKEAGEMYGEYFDRLGMRVVSMRLGNVYGGEGHHGVIANWVKAVKEDKALRMAGDGNQKRDFVWYEDVVREIVGAVEDWDKYRWIVEVGSGESTSLVELKKIFDEVVGKDIVVERYDRDSAEVDDVLLSRVKGAVRIEEGIARLINGKHD